MTREELRQWLENLQIIWKWKKAMREKFCLPSRSAFSAASPTLKQACRKALMLNGAVLPAENGAAVVRTDYADKNEVSYE